LDPDAVSGPAAGELWAGLDPVERLAATPAAEGNTGATNRLTIPPPSPPPRRAGGVAGRRTRNRESRSRRA
jgi:hypothetical protein